MNEPNIKWALACCRTCIHANGIGWCEAYSKSINPMCVCASYKPKVIGK